MKFIVMQTINKSKEVIITKVKIVVASGGWRVGSLGPQGDTQGRGISQYLEVFYFLTKKVVIQVFALRSFIILYICFEHFNLRVFYSTI